MKPINIFALMAACLLAVAMAAEEEDVVTAEQELTEEELAAEEEELAAAEEEEEEEVDEKEMEDEERGLLYSCRQSCDPLHSRCIRAPFYHSMAYSTYTYPALTYPAYRYRCVARRVIKPFSTCRRTCYARYGYGFPGCVQQCAAVPATVHKVVEPHQTSLAATFFPNLKRCHSVCPDSCFMAHRGYFQCGGYGYGGLFRGY